jgi:SGNH domain-containing protein
MIVLVAGHGPVRATTPPPDQKVLLTGDSVSVHLADVLAARLRRRLGWRLRSAAVAVCSVYGNPLAWPDDGTPRGDPDRCPSTVIPAQRRAVRAFDPDYVIWWDRLSTMPFLTANGDFVRGGTPRFWRLRARAFDDTLARLTAGGATIVFIATEPMGIGVREFCAGWVGRPCRVWKRYRLEHYDDITQRMNRILRRYALNHPGEAVFLSITDTICRWNTSPCNDRMRNGKLARPDGTHYEGRGEYRASNTIIDDMRAALFG